MDIHITNKTTNSGSLFTSSRSSGSCLVNIISKIVSSVWWRAVQTKKCSVLCCRVIDASTTSNDV